MESSKPKLFTCIPRNKRFCEHGGTNLKNRIQNALPILAYYDIFKNYYANTQEENFYIIGNTEDLIITINGSEVNPNVIPSNEGRINNTGVLTISPNTIKQNEVQIKAAKDSPIGESVTLTPGDIGTWEIIGEAITITTNKVPEGEIWLIYNIMIYTGPIAIHTNVVSVVFVLVT